MPYSDQIRDTIISYTIIGFNEEVGTPAASRPIHTYFARKHYRTRKTIPTPKWMMEYADRLGYERGVRIGTSRDICNPVYKINYAPVPARPKTAPRSRSRK